MNGTPRAMAIFLFGAIVLAFMALSLAITATGTARFRRQWDIEQRWAMPSAPFSILPKRLLPIALLVLFARRAFLLFVIIGFAWIGLVIYSALATEATVSTAIAAIERNGPWKTEARSGTKAELAAIEKRLDVLSQPAPPRPTKRSSKPLPLRKCRPASGETVRNAKAFATANIFNRPAPRFSICVASWRRPRTMSSLTLRPVSYGRRSQRCRL